MKETNKVLLLFGGAVVAFFTVLTFVSWLLYDREDVMRTKAKRYDDYCVLRAETLRQAERDLENRTVRAHVAALIAERMDARLALDDVMACNAPFALESYRQCLEHDDYACMLAVVRAAEAGR